MAWEGEVKASAGNLFRGTEIFVDDVPVKKSLTVRGPETGSLIFRLIFDPEAGTTKIDEVLGSHGLREEIEGILRDGLFEWVDADDPGLGKVPRTTLANDPLFLERTGDVLRREFLFVVEVT